MLDMTERKTWWILGGALTAGTLVALNIASDLGEADATALELLLDSFETVLMVIGAVGVGMLVDRMHVEHREKLSLIRDLSVARDEGEGWRSRVQSQVAGIGAEIERQFDSWRLTAAEREVGLLMLKGLSHKEIAAVRVTAEATVRQQARSIYQKTSLPSKTAFCAYFLEDLLPPARASGVNLVGDANDEPFPHGHRENGGAMGGNGLGAKGLNGQSAPGADTGFAFEAVAPYGGW